MACIVLESIRSADEFNKTIGLSQDLGVGIASLEVFKDEEWVDWRNELCFSIVDYLEQEDDLPDFWHWMEGE